MDCLNKLMNTNCYFLNLVTNEMQIFTFLMVS